MDMRAMGPGAGWSWLWRGIKRGFKRPGVLLGAAALFLAIAVAVGVLQFLAQLVLGLSPRAVLAFNGALMLVSAIVYPVLIGGYLGLLDKLEHGRPVGALDLFAPFRAGGSAGRLVLVGIGMFVLYALFFLLVYLTIGHAVGAWYIKLLSMTPHADGTASAIPPLPDGMGVVFAVLVVFFIFYGAAFSIALGQAALREQPVAAAIKDGLVGALKNLLPLLVLVLCSFLALFVLSMATGIVAVTLGMLAGAASPWLAVVLMVPAYAAMVLVMYTVMFGVMYAMWQDVAGGGPQHAGMPPAAHVEA